MKKYLEGYMKGLSIGMGILTILGITGVAYGAYVSMTDVNNGETLTASTFNIVQENIRTLKTNYDTLNSTVSGLSSSNVPAGFVGAFNLASCPSGWIAANGANGTPDLRGEFIRGLDSGRGVDSGRTLASAQTDTFQGHRHYITSQGAGADNVVAFGDTNSDNTYASGGNPGTRGDVYFYVGDPKSDGTNGAPRTSSETRPRNVALLYCVKQ